jgi:RNA polymerase sigma-70 factor, ECF subfamily
MTYNRFLEEGVINGLKEGNKKLFSLLFKTYYSPLCAYAATIIKDHKVAEEIVQESFIKIWENREQITIEISLKSYLYKCIHNHCLNTIKHINANQKRTDVLIKELTYHAEIVNQNFNESQLEQIVCNEMEVFFEKAIDALPDQCKEIFCLSRYDQHTYDEIAEKLSISVNTVKTQMSRALEKLREAYKKF